MNTIRRIVLTIIVPLMAGAFSACTDYQDEIDALDYRVRVLENLVKSVNSELESLQRIVRAVEDGDYITNVTENSEGYIFTFNKSGAIIIHDGVDGKDGQNGKDAQVPDISVQQDEDGFYYWTVNGEWLAGTDGLKIRANGKDGVDGKDGKDGANGKDGLDGKDGKDGADGKDGIDGKDGANGKDGIDGKDGKDGENGKDGKDGENGKDGKDGLDGKDGADGKDGVDGADGKDGKDGQNGKDGANGKDGQNGKDGKAPQVRINSSTGIWEISTDEGMTWVSTGTSALGKDGADGKDGKDGLDGKDGKDGEDGKDGKDGVDGKDGKDGKDANAIVNVVTHWNEGYVEFITSAGSFRVPLKTI